MQPVLAPAHLPGALAVATSCVGAGETLRFVNDPENTFFSERRAQHGRCSMSMSIACRSFAAGLSTRPDAGASRRTCSASPQSLWTTLLRWPWSGRQQCFAHTRSLNEGHAFAQPTAPLDQPVCEAGQHCYTSAWLSSMSCTASTHESMRCLAWRLDHADLFSGSSRLELCNLIQQFCRCTACWRATRS